MPTHPKPTGYKTNIIIVCGFIKTMQIFGKLEDDKNEYRLG